MSAVRKKAVILRTQKERATREGEGDKVDDGSQLAGAGHTLSHGEDSRPLQACWSPPRGWPSLRATTLLF